MMSTLQMLMLIRVGEYVYNQDRDDAKLTSLSLLVVKDGRQCIVIPNNLLKEVNFRAIVFCDTPFQLLS